jgi:hypothetical protein
MNKYTVVLQYPPFITDGRVQYYVALVDTEVPHNPSHPALVALARSIALDATSAHHNLGPTDFAHIATIEGHPRIWLND